MNEGVKTTPCISCAEPIKVGAHLCFHCRAEQSPGISKASILKTVGKVAVVLTFILAVDKVYGIWSQHSEAVQYQKNQINTARILFEAKDFEGAWEVLTEVQRKDPSSEIVLRSVLDISAAWLLEGLELQQGWVGRASNSKRNRALDPEQVAKIVHPALVVSAVNATNEDRADLEALIIYTRILRATSDGSMRRNYSSEFKSIHQQAPNAFYGNLLRGYWQLIFDKDLPAALDSWKTALAKGRKSSLVRRFQVTTLGSVVRSSDYGKNDEYRQQLLLILDEIRRQLEEFPNVLELYNYTSIYYKIRQDKDSFDVLISVLPAENQLAILDWVRENTVVKWTKENNGIGRPFYFLASSLEYIRARLQEQQNDHDAVLQTIAKLDFKKLSSQDLEKRFDAIIFRVTGKPPADLIERNPWKYHVYNLEHEPRESKNFQKAIQALKEWQTIWRSVGDSTIGGLLPKALDAAVGNLERWIEQSTLSGTQRSKANLLRYELRVFRGALLASITQFDRGVGELEVLSIDPLLPPQLRAEALFSLAVAYQDTYKKKLNAEFIRTEIQRMVYIAYISEAMSRLEAALSAGFNNWKVIESRLSKIRRTFPEHYTKLSLKYGRVPPRMD